MDDKTVNSKIIDFIEFCKVFDENEAELDRFLGTAETYGSYPNTKPNYSSKAKPGVKFKEKV